MTFYQFKNNLQVVAFYYCCSMQLVHTATKKNNYDVISYLDKQKSLMKGETIFK